MVKNWIILFYGIALILFSIAGYAAGSKVSLYSGGTFGLLQVLSAILMFRDVKWGQYFATFLTAALIIVFSVRYAATGKSLPAILAAVSAAVLIYMLTQIIRWRR